MDSDHPTATTPTPGHQFYGASNVPVVANFTPIAPRLLIATKIMQRHEKLGTFRTRPSEPTTGADLFQEVTEAPVELDKLGRRKRRKVSRAASSRPLMFFSLAFFCGRTLDHYSGLRVHQVSPERIGAKVGLGGDVAYAALRDLCELGVIERITHGGNVPDSFNVLMPQLPEGVNDDVSDRDFEVEFGEAIPTVPAARSGSTSAPDSTNRPEGPFGRLSDESLRARGSTSAPGSTNRPETDAPVHVHVHVPIKNSEHVHEHDGGGAGGGSRKAKLRALAAVEIGGKRLDPPGRYALVEFSNCTVANIAKAEALTRAAFSKSLAKGKPFNPMRYLFSLIKRGIREPGQEGRPEGMREAEGLQDERTARAEAENRRLVKFLEVASPGELNSLREQWLADPDVLRVFRPLVGEMRLQDPRTISDFRRWLRERLNAPSALTGCQRAGGDMGGGK